MSTDEFQVCLQEIRLEVPLPRQSKQLVDILCSLKDLPEPKWLDEGEEATFLIFPLLNECGPSPQLPRSLTLPSSPRETSMEKGLDMASLFSDSDLSLARSKEPSLSRKETRRQRLERLNQELKSLESTFVPGESTFVPGERQRERRKRLQQLNSQLEPLFSRNQPRLGNQE